MNTVPPRANERAYGFPPYSLLIGLFQKSLGGFVRKILGTFIDTRNIGISKSNKTPRTMIFDLSRCDPLCFCGYLIYGFISWPAMLTL